MFWWCHGSHYCCSWRCFLVNGKSRHGITVKEINTLDTVTGKCWFLKTNALTIWRTEVSEWTNELPIHHIDVCFCLFMFTLDIIIYDDINLVHFPRCHQASLAERSKAVDLRPTRETCVGSNPTGCKNRTHSFWSMTEMIQSRNILNRAFS